MELVRLQNEIDALRSRLDELEHRTPRPSVPARRTVAPVTGALLVALATFFHSREYAVSFRAVGEDAWRFDPARFSAVAAVLLFAVAVLYAVRTTATTRTMLLATGVVYLFFVRGAAVSAPVDFPVSQTWVGLGFYLGLMGVAVVLVSVAPRSLNLLRRNGDTTA